MPLLLIPFLPSSPRAAHEVRRRLEAAPPRRVVVPGPAAELSRYVGRLPVLVLRGDERREWHEFSSEWQALAFAAERAIECRGIEVAHGAPFPDRFATEELELGPGDDFLGRVEALAEPLREPSLGAAIAARLAPFAEGVPTAALVPAGTVARVSSLLATLPPAPGGPAAWTVQPLDEARSTVPFAAFQRERWRALQAQEPERVVPRLLEQIVLACRERSLASGTDRWQQVRVQVDLLARLRGRALASPYEILEGVASVLGEGRSDHPAVVCAREVLQGTLRGQLTADAPAPPLALELERTLELRERKALEYSARAHLEQLLGVENEREDDEDPRPDKGRADERRRLAEAAERCVARTSARNLEEAWSEHVLEEAARARRLEQAGEALREAGPQAEPVLERHLSDAYLRLCEQLEWIRRLDGKVAWRTSLLQRAFDRSLQLLSAIDVPLRSEEHYLEAVGRQIRAWEVLSRRGAEALGSRLESVVRGTLARRFQGALLGWVGLAGDAERLAILSKLVLGRGSPGAPLGSLVQVAGQGALLWPAVVAGLDAFVSTAGPGDFLGALPDLYRQLSTLSVAENLALRELVLGPRDEMPLPDPDGVEAARRRLVDAVDHDELRALGLEGVQR